MEPLGVPVLPDVKAIYINEAGEERGSTLRVLCSFTSQIVPGPTGTVLEISRDARETFSWEDKMTFAFV